MTLYSLISFVISRFVLQEMSIKIN